MSEKISVTVLSWDRLQYLRRVVAALNGLPRNYEYEFILFDNGSGEDTKKYIHSLNKWRILEVDENKGIGYGMNRLFEASTGSAIVHVEDDFQCLRGGAWLSEGLWLLRYIPTIVQLQLRDRTDPVLRVKPRHIIETVRVDKELFHIYGPTKGEHAWSNQAHLILRERRESLHPFMEFQQRGSQERSVNDECLNRGWHAAQLVTGAFKHIGLHQRLELLALQSGTHPVIYKKRNAGKTSISDKIRHKGRSPVRPPLNNDPVDLRVLPRDLTR